MLPLNLPMFKIFDQNVKIAARRLLGCVIERRMDGNVLRGMIVETEAYDQTDAASHSYNGITSRNQVMFGPSGRLYVYFTYGMHHCANIVVGGEGHGAAVLIRAVQPLEGEEAMAHRRHGRGGVSTTNGPAKFCQAFGIDMHLNGHDLSHEPVRLVIMPQLPEESIGQSKRIGISKAVREPWRFYIKNNPYVSRRI